MNEDSVLDNLPESQDLPPERISQFIYKGTLPTKFATFGKKFSILAYNHTTEQSKMYELTLWWSKEGKMEYGWTSFSSLIQGDMMPMLSVIHDDSITYEFSFSLFANLHIEDESTWSFKAKEISSVFI